MTKASPQNILRLWIIVLGLWLLPSVATAQEEGLKEEESNVAGAHAYRDQIRKAIAVAKAARAHAHAPYSGFKMGAAVGTEQGILVPGSLVENVSLGLAMCAERVALFSSVALNAGRPKFLVLVSPRTDGKLTFPCGACLQVALELGGPDLHVEACDLQGKCEGTKLSKLAPRLPRKE
jgi:cytidine deaminase